jgi:hypothetical protein
MKHAFVFAAAFAALAACTVNNNAPADNGTDVNAPADPSPDLTTPPAEVSTPANNSAETGTDAASPPTTTSIPAAFQGRWGLVPLDCTGDPSAAKGLILIDGKTIKFYESRASLTKVTMDAPENFTGNFDFMGEGQAWTKSENLRLANSSNTLTRTDDEGSYKYMRCAQP